jgi:hypothetical protein
MVTTHRPNLLLAEARAWHRSSPQGHREIVGAHKRRFPLDEAALGMSEIREVGRFSCEIEREVIRDLPRKATTWMPTLGGYHFGREWNCSLESGAIRNI